MEVSLLKLTYPEAAALLARNPVVVIPTGSVEQHGSHLPLGTDWYAAHLLARRVATTMEALLVPFTPMGVTPIHMSFSGTISLAPETFMALLGDVCESMIRHGAQRIVILNWHELNKPLIDIVAARLQQAHPIRFILVQAHFVAQQLFGQEVGLTHGGLLEALPVLAYDPQLAKLEKATDASPRDTARKLDRLRRQRETYTVVHDVREMYPTGWYGTVDGATVEKAEEFATAVSDKIVAYVREALDALAPEEGAS